MSDAESEPLSEAVVFDVLSSPRRRYVLYYLRRTGGRAELNEIAAGVAAWENGVPIEELSRQQRKRVYVSLYQTHVPKLETVGIVEYDPDAGIVELADRAGVLDEHLDRHGKSERSWGRYYLVLSAVSAILLAAALVGLFPLSGFVVAALIVSSVATLAIVQFALERHRPTDVPPDVGRTDD